MIIIDALFFQMATGNILSMDDWVPHVRDPGPRQWIQAWGGRVITRIVL